MELPLSLLQMGIQRGSILLSDSFEDIDHAKFLPLWVYGKIELLGSSLSIPEYILSLKPSPSNSRCNICCVKTITHS